MLSDMINHYDILFFLFNKKTNVKSGIISKKCI